KTNAYDLLRVNAVKDGKEEYIAYVILVDKSFVTGDLEFKGKGYLGVASINANAFKESLAHPFQASEGNPFLFFYYSINYILLPLQRLSPFPTSITMNFVITGPLSFLPSEIFWIAANAFYWLFWLNLMVGITNTLPATPLDGGLIFRDWLDTLFSKFKLSKEKRENYVKLTSRAMSVTILFMILWLIIAPRLMAILF
ncbi:MAG: site-2 protease family protein, partial [Thermoplasmata archaeon]